VYLARRLGRRSGWFCISPITFLATGTQKRLKSCAESVPLSPYVCHYVTGTAWPNPLQRNNSGHIWHTRTTLPPRPSGDVLVHNDEAPRTTPMDNIDREQAHESACEAFHAIEALQRCDVWLDLPLSVRRVISCSHAALGAIADGIAGE
jgi:hypothetical protein